MFWLIKKTREMSWVESEMTMHTIWRIFSSYRQHLKNRAGASKSASFLRNIRWVIFAVAFEFPYFRRHLFWKGSRHMANSFTFVL